MSRNSQPVGHVTGPLVIFASLALVLGCAAELLGIFRAFHEKLAGFFPALGRGEAAPVLGISSPVGILIGAAVTFGLVGAILGTPGNGRRFVLGLTMLMVGFGFWPVLAVWGVQWNPGGLTLATLWAWFSAHFYASHHRMPCDFGQGEPAGNVISLENSRSSELQQRRADGQG